MCTWLHIIFNADVVNPNHKSKHTLKIKHDPQTHPLNIVSKTPKWDVLFAKSMLSGVTIFHKTPVTVDRKNHIVRLLHSRVK